MKPSRWILAVVGCLAAALFLAAVLARAAVAGGRSASGSPQLSGGSRMIEKITLSEAQWRQRLTPEQYYVMRERGTEKPFSAQCWNPHGTGTFVCAACRLPLFEAGKKFESGTGWPSFYDAMSGGRVLLRRDTSHGLVREEAVCARCESHLGHVFRDGPPPTGLRYCMNGVALDLARVEKATFAAGCFWGVQAAFDETPGVLHTTAGYIGGQVKNPTYEQVCSHTTGHAEAVEVEFDRDVVSYPKLLELFWKIHNPRQKGGQGVDIGENYRSAIFTHSEEQQREAGASKAKQERPGFPPVVTEIVAAGPFYPAEDYHQHYKSAACRVMFKEPGPALR